MEFSNLSKLASLRITVLFTMVLGFCLLDPRLQVINVVESSQRSSAKITVENTALLKRYQQLITPELLAARLHFLASDLFEGRETTTRGQKLAAQYLASQYRELGLTPKGNAKTARPFSPASYFQSFNVYRRTPEQARLEVSVAGRTLVASSFSRDSHDNLAYFLSGDLRNATGGVVFAGYGIADDKLGYNDYAALSAQGTSIEGKWLVILDDEPLADATSSLLPTPDHKPSKWCQFIFKRPALIRAGQSALGFLVVTDSSPRQKNTFAEAAALASGNARRVGAVSLNPHSDAVPAYAISTKLADQLLAGSGHTVSELKQQIDHSLKPVVFPINGVNVTTQAEQSKSLETENVLAFIEGSDPVLKDEVLVISAHYDHLGLNPNLKGDQIFNGAADDGSGVVASLELARAFMQAKRDGFGPRRSILFINFSAEEKGTLGSFHYVHREPLVALDKTVADINMDGVGGFDLKHPTQSKNYIYVVGEGDLSKQLILINQAASKTTGSKLELTNHDYFASDQYNFQAALVPFIYYSTGLTEHYHQPSDEPETIDYEHLSRVTQLIFATAWQVANQNTRPTSVDRSKLRVVGYVCPPCPYECDDKIYDHPGECPVCGMNLIPRYAGAGVNGE